ncbi:DNA mismatch repair protein Mlh1-like isoform 1 [Anopheles sinensis]|uniref:DNA mismatch repair protein Mlh1-like isoform 1 n=1 Tax=Anopheles sinensis TaxID=74873 RepID=A0A084WQ68_ANOSI|nr:DNA mismatch repair protein Mlh1-like isoform 1 [Anopheles sinensis]
MKGHPIWYMYCIEVHLKWAATRSHYKDGPIVNPPRPCGGEGRAEYGALY